MTKFLASVLIAGSVIALIPTEASAWYCRARSPSAWGWGRSDWVGQAKRIALDECAARTPRYETCYIRFCR
jgi:hypothetical protein